MGKDWHFGAKSRRKLFVPKKKLRHNLANLSSKKCKTNTDNDHQVIYNLLLNTNFSYFFYSIDDNF